MSAGGAGLRRRTSGPADECSHSPGAPGIVVVAVLLFSGGGGYRVTAEFLNAGQLVKGSEVATWPASPLGSVEDIDVSQDGNAEVTFSVQTTTTRRCGRARGDHQAHLAVGDRQPLHRPAARPGRRGDRRRRDDRPRPDGHGGRVRPGLQPVQQGHAHGLRTSSRARRYVSRPRAASCGAASTTSTRLFGPALGCSRSSPATTRC